MCISGYDQNFRMEKIGQKEYLDLTVIFLSIKSMFFSYLCQNFLCVGQKSDSIIGLSNKVVDASDFKTK